MDLSFCDGRPTCSTSPRIGVAVRDGPRAADALLDETASRRGRSGQMDSA